MWAFVSSTNVLYVDYVAQPHVDLAHTSSQEPIEKQ